MNWCKLFFLSGVLCGLSACGGSHEKMLLVNTRWVLESVDGQLCEVSNDSEMLTLSFEEKNNRINGMAFCNLFFADYEVEEQSIRISSIGATRMVCPNEALELKYFKQLELANTYKVEDSHLYLMKDDRILVSYVAEKK